MTESYLDRLIDDLLNLTEEEREQFISRMQQVIKSTACNCEDLAKAFSNLTQALNGFPVEK